MHTVQVKLHTVSRAVVQVLVTSGKTSSWEPACRVISGTRKEIARLSVGVWKLLSFSCPTWKPLKQLGIAQFEPQFEVTPVLSSQDV